MKWLSPLVLALAAGVVSAQTTQEKKIEDLEKRVKELEAAKGEAKPADKPADGGVTWKDLVTLGGKMKWYGLLRLDTHYDDSRFDNPRFATFVRSEDDQFTVAGVTTAERNDDEFVMSPRLTRLGFNLDAGTIPELKDAKVGGKLEIDFFALPSSESRAVPRMRHAYGTLTWDWFSILFGQTADLASPLAPSLNPDNVLWNWGNTGDRRPQIRVSMDPSIVKDKFKFLLAVMAGQQGAITNSDLDGVGVRDGDDPGWPVLQARMGFQIASPGAEKKWITIAGFAMYGAEELDKPGIDGKTHFDTYMYGLDVDIPVYEKDGFGISLRGEWWEGINLADIRGGIGQGINAGNGQEIRARGGWGELKVAPVKFYAITFGASTDDPHDHEFIPGMREKNTVYYLMNTFKFSPFTMSLDISRWRTEFDTVRDGDTYRYTLTLQVEF